jgi:hypothetical protein
MDTSIVRVSGITERAGLLVLFKACLLVQDTILFGRKILFIISIGNMGFVNEMIRYFDPTSEEFKKTEKQNENFFMLQKTGIHVAL